MTTSLVAAAFFGGNIEASRSFLDESTPSSRRRSPKSRFNRRLHAIDPYLWRMLFAMCVGRSFQARPLRANLCGGLLLGRLPCATTTFAFAAAQALPSGRTRRSLPPRLHGEQTPLLLLLGRSASASSEYDWGWGACGVLPGSSFRGRHQPPTKEMSLDLLTGRLDHPCRHKG
jgi:hypothetical protein